MKPIYVQTACALLVSFAVAACIPAPTSTPTPEAPATPPAATRAPVASAEPAPVTAPEPIARVSIPENWLDQPRAAGNWTYAAEGMETFAIYGEGRNDARAIVRCDLATREVGIGVFGSNTPATLRILTETSNRTLNAEPRDSGLPLIAAVVRGSDPILDSMALTRGRFVLQHAGRDPLYLPAWAEVTRVIEDCR